jgi:hypothetical protein
MARKRKKMSPEERAAWEQKTQEVLRMLQERIDYYDAKLGKRSS